MSLLTEASLVILPNAVEEGELLSIIPADGSGDMTAVRATTATLVNSERVIEDVAINVPRLDYTNGSCPSILVEPQRTNLLLRSEEFNVSPWGTLGTITITPNSTIAPDGNNTADLILGNNASSFISQIYGGSIGVVYTSSFFIKNNNSTQSQLLIRNASTVVEAALNWTGSVLSSITNTTGITTFQSYNNGWYRIISTYTSVEAAQRPRILPTLSTNQSVFLWGAQLEAGSNATSYIPTVASAVTRNADVISKTGISDLIGQTEGTIFVDCKNVKNGLSRLFEIFNSSNTSTNIFLNITSAGGLQMVLNNSALPVAPTINVIDLGKFIFKYTENTIKIFNNGVLVGTYSGTISFANELNTLSIGGTTYTPRTINGEINSVVLFKTALTDQQCINLTSI